MSSVFREILQARIASAITSADSLTSVKHSGLKGSLREIVLRDLLKPLLPYSAGLAQGEVIDHNGGTSSQQDIVIYDKQLVPAMLIDRSNGIIPIESVLYTIEVKSKTNTEEIRKSVENAKSILNLRGYNESNTTEKTITCIFAFNSDLTRCGKTELQRYLEIDTNEGPSIRSICVVGRGYWFFNDNKWHEIPTTASHDEVIHFLAGILNTYSRVLSTRKTSSISQYLN